MPAFAVCRQALAQKDMSRLASLMDRNFVLRLSMFGEAALGEANLKMINLARSVGGETLSYLLQPQTYYFAVGQNHQLLMLAAAVQTHKEAPADCTLQGSLFLSMGL